MIKLIREDGADAAAELAWSLQQTPELSAFPRYRSREALREELLKMLKLPEGQLIGCYDGAELRGMMCLYIDNNSKYVESVCGMYASGGDPAVYAELAAHAVTAFAGYEMLFSFPEENAAAAAALRDAGAELYESCVSLRLAKQDFRQGQSGGVNKLGKERFAEYAAFHDAAFPDYYWTAARIREARDKWDVNVYMDSGKICGGVFTAVWDKNEAEIFGAALDEKHRGRGLEARLITRACSEAFRMGKKSVLFFVSDSDPALLAAAKKCGFAETSTYRCYRFRP